VSGPYNTPVLDSFTRANASTLGSNWTADPLHQSYVSFGIVSNLCENNGHPSCANWWSQNFFPASQEAYVTVTQPGSGTYSELLCRVQFPGTASARGYALRWDSSHIYVYNPAGTDISGSLTPTVSAGDRVGLSCVGNQITAWHDTGSGWVNIWSGTDTTYAGSGYVGLVDSNDSGTLELSNFGGGATGMVITNNTNDSYWFGPLHLPAGTKSFLAVDDTSDTSLYLLRDDVADTINTLVQSQQITVNGANTPFPRPTGVPTVYHGDGSPEGIVYAAQGSVYMRRDNPGATSALYVKTTGITQNIDWQAISAQEVGPNGTPYYPSFVMVSTFGQPFLVTIGGTVAAPAWQFTALPNVGTIEQMFLTVGVLETTVPTVAALEIWGF
jgi:hypothetical protein